MQISQNRTRVRLFDKLYFFVKIQFLMHSVFNVYAFVCACQTKSFFYFLVISKLLQRLKKISTTFNFYIKKGNIKCYIFSNYSTTLQKVEAGFDGR